MKRILVTGSNGLLGSTLVRRLKDEPSIQLFATSRGANRLRNRHGYSYHDVDLLNFGAVQDMLNQIRPNVIIHTAAMTQVDMCEEHPELCIKINADVPGFLAEESNRLGFRLVHLSTDFVFSGKNPPYYENAPTDPVSLYGRSKVMAEKRVESAQRHSIIRTILVYGVSEEMSRSNLILWVKKSLEAGEPIRVVNDQFRMPTWVGDLAQGCVAATKHEVNGIYHISGPIRHSVYELALMTARHYGLDESLISPVSSMELNQPGDRPVDTSFNLDKAKEQLAYNPLTFSEGLKAFSSSYEEIHSR